MPWKPGDVVALRDVWFGSVWRAVATVVVDDAPGRSVFWVPAGSDAAYAVDDAGKEIRIPSREFHRGRRRTKSPMVVVCDAGAPWTMWLFFTGAGFDHWYVNFERFLGRSEIAWDGVDHKLDLIVHRDGELVWKDEEELETAAQLGLVDAGAVRRDAELALAEPPWPTGWEDFSPDPSREPPELPEGWDSL